MGGKSSAHMTHANDFPEPDSLRGNKELRPTAGEDTLINGKDDVREKSVSSPTLKHAKERIFASRNRNQKRKLEKNVSKIVSHDNELSRQAEDAVSTPVRIRREHKREMEQSRPELTSPQMELVLQTWQILQEDLAKLGSDIFLR